MKTALACLIVLSACVSVFADDFTTTDGKKFEGVTVTRIEADGIMVMTDSGIAKIFFAKLPEDVQKKYGYDPAKAAQFQQQMQIDAAARRARDATAMQAEAAAKRAAQGDANVAAPPLKPSAAMELPVVTASTVATKKKDVVEDGIRTTVRSMGAEVGWRYFHRPELPFEVQCFFVAKDESTKIQFCWDYQSNKSGEQVGKFRFDSKDLTGTGAIIGLGSQFDFPGAKIDGWIIRFIRDGKVIRVTSNQSHLEQLANSQDHRLDEIAEKGVR